MAKPFFMENNTVDRVHLDKGRMLVLIPHQYSVSTNVKIVGGIKPYVVKVEEDATPVDMLWLESLLALRKSNFQDDQNPLPKRKSFQICWPKEVGEAFSVDSTKDFFFF